MGRRTTTIHDAVLRGLTRTVARRRPRDDRPVDGRRVRPDGPGDRPRDETEPEEGDVHGREYRSPARRSGAGDGPSRASRTPRAVVVVPRARHLAVASCGGPRFGARCRPWPCSWPACLRRTPPVALDRPEGSPAGSPGDGPIRVAHHGAGRRSADNAAPPRRARRAERSCRPAVHTTSTRGGASRPVPGQTCGRLARAASTRSSGYS